MKDTILAIAVCAFVYLLWQTRNKKETKCTWPDCQCPKDKCQHEPMNNEQDQTNNMFV